MPVYVYTRSLSVARTARRVYGARAPRSPPETVESCLPECVWRCPPVGPTVPGGAVLVTVFWLDRLHYVYVALCVPFRYTRSLSGLPVRSAGRRPFRCPLSSTAIGGW